MKRFFNLLTIAAFLVTASMAVAADKAQPAGKGTTAAPAQTVNCCVNKQCKKAASEADCVKAGGKVVKDCKDCK